MTKDELINVLTNDFYGFKQDGDCLIRTLPTNKFVWKVYLFDKTCTWSLVYDHLLLYVVSDIMYEELILHHEDVCFSRNGQEVYIDSLRGAY